MSTMKRSCFCEAHFCVLPTQSNVYGMCHFSTALNRAKVLVACLNGDILLFEYCITEANEIKPISNIFRLNYISREIISMDVFVKNENTPDAQLVIGITFLEDTSSTDDSAQYGFNIFTKSLRDGDKFLHSKLQPATEGGLPLSLKAIPCQVTHTQVPRFGKDEMETVFLLSTNDRVVTVYQEVDEGTFSQCDDTAKFFPELSGTLRDVVYFMDFRYYDNNRKRLTCTGTAGGFVHCYIIDLATNEILRTFGNRGLGPVTSVVIFREDSDAQIPQVLNPLYDGEKDKQHTLHLLVTHTLEVASVYRDVLTSGLSEQVPLHHSYNYDSVMCSCVTDVDFDGANELILGTYGQRILAYKFDGRAENQADCTHLLWQHSLQYPIHSLIPLDLTGDGLKDLAVLSIRGLHILQKDIKKASDFIEERLVDLQQGFDMLNLHLKAEDSKKEVSGNS